MRRNCEAAHRLLVRSRWLGLLLILGLVVAAASEATADDGIEAQAERHNAQGKAFFRVGEYALCAAEFRSSYALMKSPGALFNEARCREENGDHLAAKELFDQYIAAAPEGAQVVEATARSAALATKIRESEAANESSETSSITTEVSPDTSGDPAAPPAPVVELPKTDASIPEASASQVNASGTPQPRSRSNTKRLLAITTGAAGLVGLGVGTVIGLGAKSDWDRAQELCPNNSPCTNMEGVTLSRDAKSSAQLTTLVVGLSAVSLAAATYFWLSQPSEGEMAVSVAPASSGAGGSVYLGMEF